MHSSTSYIATILVILSFLGLAPHASAAPPVISSFASDVATIAPGDTAVLSWSVSGFDTITINGVSIQAGTTSTPVAPLITTTYTLVATNPDGSDSAQVPITVLNSPDFAAAEGRFIEVVKNNTTNTRLHISEIEAFSFGETPNSAHADGTSSNDLVQAGSPSTETPPTTTVLEHGNPSTVFDGDLESGAAVWTTKIGQGVKPRYMLDLGSTEAIGTVRIFGRADTCCQNRLENVTINIYADDGSGKPGSLVSSADFPGTAPSGNVGPIELDLAIPDPGINAFVVDKRFIPQGEPITLSWAVNNETTSVSINNGVGNVTDQTGPTGVGSVLVDPGPNANTTYTLTTVRPSGSSTATVAVEVTNLPLIYSLTADDSLVAPGTLVTLSWSVANATTLTLNGADVTAQNSAAFTATSSGVHTLVASNANGSTSKEINIRVVIPGEPIISEFLASNDGGLHDEDGEASDWIELHNPGPDPVSLLGYYLTDDAANLTKWALPDVTLAGDGYLVLFATGNDRSTPGSELHTNFSLATVGEYLALVKPDGTTIVTDFPPQYPRQHSDVSYGFDSVNAIDGFFTTPTPGAANSSGFTGFVADTVFSIDRGFYTNPIQVAITSASPDAQVRYTVNGTKPTATTGLVYTSPITISQTTVLRAAAFQDGFIPTNVDTHTYIFTADVISHSNMSTNITQDAIYAPLMDASLQSIPSISLTFLGDVARTEKEVSMEMINFPDGDAQVDAGMVRFGSYVTNFAKRGIRITFRNEYGPGKLAFPIFAGQEYQNFDPADRVDGIDLRAGNHDMKARGAYMSNRFTDDAMLDMGQISPHGRFVHLYLNGLYWGQYHLRERWNAAMLAEYFGGQKVEYEAINANNSGNQFLTGKVYDGTGDYWQATQQLIAGGTPFASTKDHLDMDNLIDFMLLWVSGNSESEFRAAGSVPLGVPFKFFMKDADGFLRNPGHSASHNGPLNAMSRLATEGDPEYRILLADRIHKHFYNDGALTPAKNIARLQARVDEIQLSFLSESARWESAGFTWTPTDWQNFQDNLLNNSFPALTNTMINRFKSAGMYPSTAAPTFNQHGGAVPPAFRLGITAPVGTIYYTSDGSDPREPADPIEVDPPVTILSGSAGKTVHVPLSATDGFTDNQARSWTTWDYNDNSWRSGSGGVGYEDANGYQSYISIDVLAEMSDQRASCLVRIPFTPTASELSGKTGLQIGVRYDDGYVAYLNGIEIARKNFIGTPDGNSAASAQHADGAAIAYEIVDISTHLGLLQPNQENILAIHALNVSTGSSDFLINAELTVSAAPVGGGTGGAISSTAIEYTGRIPIASTLKIRARVLDGLGNWSALNEATFFQDPAVIVVSEMMYNPSSPTPAEIAAGHNDSEDFEFLEILNTGIAPIDLTGLRFTDGIGFDYTGADITTLAAGARAIIVEDRLAFEFRYGSGHPIAGQYTGKLKDEGETVTFSDQSGTSIRTFFYDNTAPWPTSPDGGGPSLVLLDPNSIPDHNIAANWQASEIQGGTPGVANIPSQSFASWANAYGVSTPEADFDHDGLSNYLEFLLLSSPLVPSPGVLPAATIEDNYLTLTFTHKLAAGNVTTGEVSTNLADWSPAVIHRVVYHADGTATTTLRSPTPIPGNLRQFIRILFQ